MTDQIEEVKAKTDIVSLIGEFIELKKAGRNYKALCPFHSEKTPSFMVSPELQIFKCFGCNESGDPISFLQKYEGMDFGEALKFLADKAGIKLRSFKGQERGEKERLYEINKLAANFYHYILLKHQAGKAALSYLLKQRGLKPDTIKTFQLGYSPDVPFALKKLLIDKKGFNYKELARVGLVYSRDGKVFDRFRGRIIFPLFDHRGNAIGLAGRIPPSKEKRDLAKYINSPETPVYHKSRVLYGLNLTRSDIKRKRSAVVVEGELDMISSWQVGVKNTVAIKGSALTEDQVSLLSRFTKNLILAPDSDLAGDAAARRGITIAQKKGLEVKVARLGNYKDPDEMARKNTAGYKKALKSSVGVWDFIIDSIFSKEDVSSGQGKGRISQEIIPVLASIPDKIVQAHYVEMVARKLGVATDAVIEQITTSKTQEERQKPQKVVIDKPKTKSRQQLLEERLLTLAFQSEPKILLKRNIFSLVKTPLAKRILEEYKSFSQKHKSFNPSEFADAIPSELVDGFAELTLADIRGLTDKPEALKKELDLVIKELRVLEIKTKLLDLTKKIGELEKKKDNKNLKKAEKEFSELSRKLAKLREDEIESKIL